MALMFPADLEAWHRWQISRNPLRRMRNLGRRDSAPALWLITNAVDPVLLVAVDSTTPTTVAAFTNPLHHLHDLPIAVLAPADISAQLPGQWTAQSVSHSSVPPALSAISTVFAAGHYLPVSSVAHDWSRTLKSQFVIAQHGLMTTWAPPLPAGAHVLAFSDADGEYWASGRTDTTHEVVGSQLFWRAAQRPLTPDPSASPLFLGQLHGAELSRRTSARSAQLFCETTGASYRPHPSETDRLSRAQHAIWRRRGIAFDDSGAPLSDNRRPIASIFSTGVLEAAAAGIPSWVTAVRPPEWVRDFWDRYGMSLWGAAPTASPAIPAIEPARAIAASLERLTKEGAR